MQVREEDQYYTTQMQKDLIIEKLKERGCRITRQRRILLDVILGGTCASCKEIYYQASKQDANIGTATVYRMVNLLEQIDALNRVNAYEVTCAPHTEGHDGYIVELDDSSVRFLSDREWNRVIEKGMRACGYIDKQNIRMIKSEMSGEEGRKKIASLG